jgi:hypothetical protein
MSKWSGGNAVQSIKSGNSSRGLFDGLLLHGSLLLAIVTMVLVEDDTEERNVIQCVKIYEEFSAALRFWCVVACCLKAAASGTMPKVEA